MRETYEGKKIAPKLDGEHNFVKPENTRQAWNNGGGRCAKVAVDKRQSVDRDAMLCKVNVCGQSSSLGRILRFMTFQTYLLPSILQVNVYWCFEKKRTARGLIGSFVEWSIFLV